MKMTKTKHQYTALFLPILISCAFSLNAQEAQILNSRETTLEWAYLDRIKNGGNIPTTVQSLSAKEASFYGLNTGIESVDESFYSGKISVQPFLIGWNGVDLSRRMTTASLLNRLRLENPVLDIGASFGSGPFYGKVQLDFVTDSMVKYAEADGFSGFWNPKAFLSYWTFPDEGYLSWSDKNITLAVGRLPTGIGLGKTNIVLNGQARWYDQIQFSWWSTHFRLFSLWGTSSAFLNEEEYEIQNWSKLSTDKKSWGWDAINNHDASTQELVPFKMFTYHRFEFKPFQAIGFGLTEMQLVGGKVPDLTNLLPTVYWHNTYSPGVSNVMIQADTWFVPIKGLLVYGEFLMDDSKAPSESAKSKPNCWGWEVGTKLILPIDSNNWRFSLAAEYNHIDKWTYNRWQPYLTMYQRQMITGGWTGFDIPLGHNEGGDVDQASLTLTALERGGKRIELSYSYINKGAVYLGMISDTVGVAPDGTAMRLPIYYDNDASITSVRKHSHVINLKALWQLSPQWEANGEIDFRLVLNAGHVAGERATELVYKTGLTWTYGK